MRHFLFASAVLAGLSLAASPALADAASDLFAGFQAKSKDPIQVDAQALEVHEEGPQRISVFSGGVTIKRGNTLMKAGTVTLYSGTDATASSAFTRIEAGGKISVVSGAQTVTGDNAVVDMKANTITVAGGVVLSQGDNVITGSRLIVNLATGRARVEQDPGKQIRGVFSPGGITPGQSPGATPAQ
jgi:lipopolysaccharide export system protein LptA